MKDNFPFFYDNQIKRYILQFMAVFASLKVQHDDGEIQQLSVRYSEGDRVAESIFAGNNQNKLLSLPIGSCYFQDIVPALNRAKGTNTIRTTTIAPPGTLPSEVQYVNQVQPKPYDMRFSIKIWTSNLNQMFQLTEQICSFFDPVIQIQTSNSKTDPTAVTTLKLESITTENDAFGGTEKSKYIKTFTFVVEGWLYTPIELRNDIINTIQVNISMVESVYANFDFGDLTFDELVASVNTTSKIGCE